LPSQLAFEIKKSDSLDIPVNSLIKYFGKDIKIEAAFCFKKNDNFVLILGAISRFRLNLF
jgi:hypothetical protein